MHEAIIVTDLSFGDAGKGTTVDYLVRQARSSAVIRYNGGPQAAHNVVTDDGRHHTFAQFGSGSFVPGVVTHLSSDMLVNPLNMFTEADHLESLGVTDAWERVSVDRRARIITPWQVAANRLREKARGDNRHGSCAQGVGETVADWLADPEQVIYVEDIEWPGRLQRKLEALRGYKLGQMQRDVVRVTDSDDDWDLLNDGSIIPKIIVAYKAWYELVTVVGADHLAILADRYDRLVFEGAQGVLLDEARGFHPYTTWSNTTPANARRQLAAINYDGPVTTLGVVRAYTTRHGVGPFVTEDATFSRYVPEHHNGVGEWQGAFRVGHLDLVAHRYAAEVSGGIDQLMVTAVDRMQAAPFWQYCTQYDTPAAPRSLFEATTQGTRIVPGTYGNLDYQSRLTAALYETLPLYDRLDTVDGTDALFSVIELTLKAPIVYASYGPTARDKRRYAVV